MAVYNTEGQPHLTGSRKTRNNITYYTQILRGRFQTIFGKINVIMTLGGRGVRALTFTLYTRLNCGSDRVAAVANGRK